MKFIKCKVQVSQLRIEQFDPKTGEPIVDKKKDLKGNPYTEVREITYRKGQEVLFPEPIVKRLGKSVEVVMRPVFFEPDVVEVGEDTSMFKKTGDEVTIADMIPNPEAEPAEDEVDEEKPKKKR